MAAALALSVDLHRTPRIRWQNSEMQSESELWRECLACAQAVLCILALSLIGFTCLQTMMAAVLLIPYCRRIPVQGPLPASNHSVSDSVGLSRKCELCEELLLPLPRQLNPCVPTQRQPLLLQASTRASKANPPGAS